METTRTDFPSLSYAVVPVVITCSTEPNAINPVQKAHHLPNTVKLRYKFVDIGSKSKHFLYIIARPNKWGGC